LHAQEIGPQILGLAGQEPEDLGQTLDLSILSWPAPAALPVLLPRRPLSGLATPLSGADMSSEPSLVSLAIAGPQTMPIIASHCGRRA
jgi:hypothetical protein